MLRTSSNLSLFGTQGQVTPKSDLAGIPTRPRCFGCPDYLQASQRSDKNLTGYATEKAKFEFTRRQIFSWPISCLD